MRKQIKTAAVCAIIGALAMSAGCSRPKKGNGAEPGGGSAAGIQIKGSDTMVNLGQAWAEAFMKKYPSASMAVTGGGSGTGIAALLNGTTDIAETSRSVEPDEIEQAKKNGVDPNEFKVALDGIAIVVNPKNKIDSLTIAQLADIFTNKITDWKEIGGAPGKIVILSREVNSGTHVYFKEHVLNNGNSKGNVEFSPTALLMSSSQAIADEVTTNVSAIGYYGIGYISSKQKALAISGKTGDEPVAPTLDNVLSGKYPISRPLYMYTNGEPKDSVKNFIDFVLSPEGQTIVKDTGFVPLK
ncbi:MAG: phosphate ABC transporter substrate-binding protein [bacterium]